jgi:hypothetical protein
MQVVVVAVFTVQQVLKEVVVLVVVALVALQIATV